MLIYDRIEDKKENVFKIFQSEGDILWLLFNGFLVTCLKRVEQVQENLKFVDFVTILVDARLPLSSQNPMFD